METSNPDRRNRLHSNPFSNTMNNRGTTFKKKMRAEALHSVFLRWLGWLLKDSGWRAYIRAKLKENELPVIDFSDKRQRRVAK